MYKNISSSYEVILSCWVLRYETPRLGCLTVSYAILVSFSCSISAFASQGRLKLRANARLCPCLARFTCLHTCIKGGLT